MAGPSEGTLPVPGVAPVMGMLANRLGNNLRHLKKWAAREDVRCYRVYDHDIPEFPLVLELYEDTAVAYLSESQRDFRAEAESEILAALQPARLIVKERGVRSGGEPLPGAAGNPTATVVSEGPLRFEVHLEEHHDTGLFLDHRKARRWLAERCRGGRVLNLFSYTGSFSVYAAWAGASRVTSLDLSSPYLDWSRRNFLLNGLDPEPHRFVQADCLRWLELCREEFDWIVCDPPTFSNSKRMRGHFEVRRHHPELIRLCRQRLSPEGWLLFSVNDRKFRLDEEVQGGEEFTDRSRSEDFRRGGGHRSWLFRKSDTATR